jgi:hypothetical protein
MRSACLSVVALALAAGLSSAADVENPEFAGWAKFKKGTAVTLKTSSTTAGTTSEILMTTTLVEVGADKLVLETATVTVVNKMEFKGPPVKRDVPKTVTVPDNVKKAAGDKPPGTVEDGAESVKVAGGEFKTTWFKTKTEVAGMKIESKMWMSDDVPGRLVKMESTSTGAVSTATKMELVEFKKP